MRLIVDLSEEERTILQNLLKQSISSATDTLEQRHYITLDKPKGKMAPSLPKR